MIPFLHEQIEKSFDKSWPLKLTAIESTAPNSGLNKKVSAALAEDSHPAKSLADIRQILVGPSRRLQDARFEEVITILEESDRAFQLALCALENRCNKLATDMQALAADTANRMREHAAAAIANNDEILAVFEARLAKLEEHSSNEHHRHIDVFADGFSDIAERLLPLKKFTTNYT